MEEFKGSNKETCSLTGSDMLNLYLKVRLMKGRKMDQKKVDSSLTERINKLPYKDIRIT